MKSKSTKLNVPNKNYLISLLTFVGLILSANMLYSQAYIPMAVDEARWIIRYDDIETPQLVDGLWEYYSSGDTTVEDHSYKKIYKRYLQPTDAAPPFEPSGSYSLSGLIRDDTLNRKVFAILFDENMFCPVEEEILLFDFSYEIGDTVTFCLVPDFLDFTIESLNQSTILGFSTWIYADDGAYEIYEGMGSYFGLFEPMFMPLKSSNTRFPDQTYLYYYCRQAPCQLVVSTPEIPGEPAAFTAYPNPVKQQLNIDISNSVEAEKIQIKNSRGQIVRSKTLNTDAEVVKFDLHDLPAGLYMVSLYKNERPVARQKIILLGSE